MDQTVLNSDAEEIELPRVVLTESDLNEILTEEQESYGDKLHACVIVNRSRAARSGNDELVKKWAVECGHFASNAIIRALHEVQFNAETLDGMAIYAAQKVRRLTQAYLGSGRIDPYTAAVLKNADALHRSERAMNNATMMASLTTKLKTNEELAVRRASAVKTASTQACSSRKALIALGAARIEGEGKDKSFVVDFSHPFIAQAMKAMV